MTSPPDSDAAAASSTVKTSLRTHALPLVLVALSTLCAGLGTSATEWLRYDRGEILHGLALFRFYRFESFRGLIGVLRSKSSVALSPDRRISGLDC